ncbi:MAG: hypothetical protein S0880_14335 [Actinomycetota bacterium]|nr:hypothetical protein [Actinomycetota bacterium]
MWKVENCSRWYVRVGAADGADPDDVRDGDGSGGDERAAVVARPDDELVLAPLEARLLGVDPASAFPIGSLLRRHVLAVQPLRSIRQRESWWEWLPAAAVGALAVYVVGAMAVGELLWSAPAFVVGSLAAAAVVLAGVVVGNRTAQAEEDALVAPADDGAMTETIADRAAVGSGLRRLTGRTLAVAAVTLVAAAVGAALYYGTDLRDVATFGASGVELTDDPAGRELVGRLVQLVFVVVLTLLPALALGFDGRRSVTEDHRLREVFRLRPDLATRAEVEAAYGPLVAGVSARNWVLPVAATTAIAGLGWTLVMVATEIGSSGALLELVSEDATLLTYAFVGGYLGVLRSVIGASMSGSLRPQVYVLGAYRFVWTLVAAALVEAAPLGIDTSAGIVVVAAFVVAFAPTSVWRTIVGIGSMAMRSTGGLARVVGVPSRPLEELDGLGPADRARLAAAGVRDVDGLVSADAVALSVTTGIEVGQLLRWTDEALLVTNLPELDRLGDGSTMADVRSRLAAIGVRRATELLELAEELDGEDVAVRNGVVEIFAAASEDDDALASFRFRRLLSALAEDPAVASLRQWRAGTSSLGEDMDPVRSASERPYLDTDGIHTSTGLVVDLRPESGERGSPHPSMMERLATARAEKASAAVARERAETGRAAEPTSEGSAAPMAEPSSLPRRRPRTNGVSASDD